MNDTTRQIAVARLHRARLADGEIWLPVSGNSMGATIAGGGRVRVQQPHRRPRRGEIWAYVSDAGGLVVHRFRADDPSGSWFRGDGNDWDDVPVPSDAIVGRVAEIDDRDGRRSVGTYDRVVGRLRLDALSVRRRIRWLLRRPSRR